jgi:hypothetical protein
MQVYITEPERKNTSIVKMLGCVAKGQELVASI